MIRLLIKEYQVDEFGVVCLIINLRNLSYHIMCSIIQDIKFVDQFKFSLG